MDIRFSGIGTRDCVLPTVGRYRFRGSNRQHDQVALTESRPEINNFTISEKLVAEARNCLNLLLTSRALEIAMTEYGSKG